MRKENCHIAKKAYRFKHWSRVGYAVFNSLHLQVSIGFLSIDLSDKIGDKKKEGYSDANLQTTNEDKPKDEIEPPDENLFLTLFPSLLLLISQLQRGTESSGIGIIKSSVFPVHLLIFISPLLPLQLFLLPHLFSKKLSLSNYLFTNLYISLNFYNDENKNHRTHCAVSNRYVNCSSAKGS